jgi:hypothetical protein
LTNQANGASVPALDRLLGTAMTTHPQKITFGEMRDAGVRSVLIYCRDHRCSHHIEISADRWSDHVRIQGLWASGCRCEAAI